MHDGFRGFGPLGSQNMRRQQGRSALLSPGTQLEERLIFTGGKGKGDGGIGDAYASAVTIACSLTGVGTVRGTLDWGTDGHAATMEFDFLQGTMLHVSGASFTLKAVLIGTGAAEEPAETDRVVAGASIGYFCAGRIAPTYTAYVAAAAAAIEIPAFAARLALTTAAATGLPGTATAQFRSAAGVVLATYLAASFAGGRDVPVPNGAADVLLSTGGAADVFAACFRLAT